MGSEDTLVFAPSRYKVKYTIFQYLLKYSSYWDDRPLNLSARPTFFISISYIVHLSNDRKCPKIALYKSKRPQTGKNTQISISHGPHVVETCLTKGYHSIVLMTMGNIILLFYYSIVLLFHCSFDLLFYFLRTIVLLIYYSIHWITKGYC